MAHDKDETGGFSTKWRDACRRELRALPAEYEQSIAPVTDLREVFYREVALALEPRFNAWLQSMPHDSLDDCRVLVGLCNRHIRQLGLATRDPKTGLPSVLAVDTSQNTAFRFRFLRYDDEGRQVRTGAYRDLPYLTLMQAAPSRTGFARDDGRRSARGR